MAKVYIWLKLPKDFFEKKLIKKMRQLPGGDSCVIVYQRLLSEAALNSGIIEIDGIEDDVSEELALIINEDAKVIKMVLAFCQKYEMVKTLVDSGNLLFPQALEMTGRETEWAKKKREQRQKKKQLKEDNVPLLSRSCPIDVPKCPTELELESELETEIEKEIDKELESELELEKRKTNADADLKSSIDQILEFYQSNFPMEYGKNTVPPLIQLLEKYGKQKLIYAITIAAAYHKSAPKYIEGVILNTLSNTEQAPKEVGEENSDLLY